MLAALLALGLSLTVAYYFTDRIEQVMRQYGMNLSGDMSHDLMHLQIQFLMGMISLAMLVLIAVMLYQKNFSCLYYEAKRDGLTGLLSRQQFFLAGEQQLAAWKPGKEGTGKDADAEYGRDLQHRRDLGAGARRPAGTVPQRGPAAAGG